VSEIQFSFNPTEPPPPQIALLEMGPSTVDKATPAAVAYLTTGSLEAWDHLMGICFRFAGDLFLLDDFGDYRLAPGEDESCSAWENDERTGELKKHRWRQEGTATRTREWIQEWLLERLHGYHGKSYAEIQNAADGGEFRYLGRQCRLALIDKLRKLNPLDNPQLKWLDDHVGDGDEEKTFGHTIGTWNTGGQSSLHRPAVRLEDVIEFIADNKLALADVMIELMVYVECACADDLREGTITRAIAKNRRIEERQARTYKQRFLDIARRAEHPALRELFTLLQTECRVEDLGKEKGEAI
jgi:hypothetical protein